MCFMRTLCSTLIFSLLHQDIQNSRLAHCSGEAAGHIGILCLLTAIRAGKHPFLGGFLPYQVCTFMAKLFEWYSYYENMFQWYISIYKSNIAFFELHDIAINYYVKVILMQYLNVYLEYLLISTLLCVEKTVSFYVMSALWQLWNKNKKISISIVYIILILGMITANFYYN